MRNQKDTYCFITDSSGKFYQATRALDGNYTVTSNAQPMPVEYNPINLIDCPVEFATNDEYISLVRSVAYPLKFVKDAAAILRDFYHLRKGTEAIAYLTIIDWDGVRNLYTLSYRGRFDFLEKNEEPKSGIFTVPLVDDSAWGVLSNNDKVQYAIECNENNPKAIRVLFDGITLVSKYIYQTVGADINYTTGSDQYRFTIPFVQINQEGDSVGIITLNQQQANFPYAYQYPMADPLTKGWFFSTVYDLANVRFQGPYEFEVIKKPGGFYSDKNTAFQVYFRTNFGQKIMISPWDGIDNHGATIVAGNKYRYDYDFTWNLSAGETVFFIIEYWTNNGPIVKPAITNTSISIKTIQQPVVRWGLRPLDLLQQLVNKGTYNRYTIDSVFFAENNKDIAFSGDSLRGTPNAKIYSSFADFFQTFSSLYFMALRSIIGQLWMEKATVVYKQDSTIIDIGNAIEVETTPAKQYFANELLVGSPDVDLRHPSGRLEFNTEDTYSLNVLSSKRKYEMVTKYRTGCYDITFLIVDYFAESTKDNSGDKTVYLARITDETSESIENVETFESVDIDNALLQPIIKSPLNNDVIHFDQPVIKGNCNPGLTVNIYADTVLDGSVIAGVDGNWSYVLQNPLSEFIDGVQTGIHVIDATFTDLAAPTSAITITINTSILTPLQVVYPVLNEQLYNNIPLIKGIAQTGTIVDITLDGVALASVVADESCKWEFKLTSPLINTSHIISVNGGADSVVFIVNSEVDYPLITYIGSELDGFPLWNNLPLIRGVAKANSEVTLWLNYIDYPGSKLGVTTADIHGAWSYQVVPISYTDPITGLPVTIAPIQNGNNIISTSLLNQNVKVGVVGYKLERPPYSSITGVTDNTVFNTAYRPANIMKAHYPMLASMMAKQQSDSIMYQTSKKNGNLRTILNGETLAENDDIPAFSLGKPLFLLEIAKIKTKVNKSFAKLLENFSNGGVVKTNYRGTDLYCLPIGSMKMNAIKSDVQEWELLMSPLTTYNSLLNLYKNGTIINIMKNSIYHSDFNTLHFVTYDYKLPKPYKVKDIYDAWFNCRNDQWAYNPNYVQKAERTDPIVIDQVITNGISNMTLAIYRCSDGILVDTLKYNPVVPAPISIPEVVLECKIDWSAYPQGTYFCVQKVGDLLVSISERIEIKDEWKGTILIESSNSINLVGCFFSTGFKTQIRVEGHIKKRQTEIDFVASKDESGNTETLYQTFNRERMIRWGTAYGLPDYLAMKIIPALTLDNLKVEGVYYDLKEGDRVTQSDPIDGHPLYYYESVLTLKSNPKGISFAGSVDDSNTNGVILVVDAGAFGLPIGSLINIELNNG